MGEKPVRKAYSYFDTPDGEDTFKKLWAVLKPTTGVAAGLATCDVKLVSHPKGFLPTLGRFAAVGLPIIGIASTFVLTTNTLANIRKKDDRLNWFIGGFVAGSCFGLWTRRTIVGFNMGMVLGILAVVRKEALIKGWRLIPDDNFPHRFGGATVCLRDFSITAERPRNWVTEIK